MALNVPAPPPPEVLAAFGLVDATVTALPGGQGSSWLATPPAAATGSRQPVVLKPVADGLEIEEVTRLAEALAPLSGAPARVTGFRVPADVPADAPGPTGRWVVGGWRASTWVTGDTGPAGRWVQLLAAAQAFTSAVAHLPRPGFLQRRAHPWAVADRAAWGEQPLAVHPDQRVLVERLRALAGRGAQVHQASQLVHGDLTENVLFSEGLPPAVIDVSPYWRPAAYAGAVVVADGLLWWGQGSDLVAMAGDSGDVSVVARAVLFRLMADVELQRSAGGAASLPAVDAVRYQHAVDVLGALGS